MQLVELFVWLISGGIAGWLTGSALKSSGGPLTDIVVGILGAFMGGLLVSVLGLRGIDVLSIFSAFVGAVLLLTVIHLLNIRRRRHLFT